MKLIKMTNMPKKLDSKGREIDSSSLKPPNRTRIARMKETAKTMRKFKTKEENHRKLRKRLNSKTIKIVTKKKMRNCLRLISQRPLINLVETKETGKCSLMMPSKSSLSICIKNAEMES